MVSAPFCGAWLNRQCPTACSLRPRASLAPTFGDCQHPTEWMSKRSRSTSRCGSCHGYVATVFSITIQAIHQPRPPRARRSKPAWRARSASVNCPLCRAGEAPPATVRMRCLLQPEHSGATGTLEVSMCTRALSSQPVITTAANGSFAISPGHHSASCSRHPRGISNSLAKGMVARYRASTPSNGGEVVCAEA